MYRKPQQPRAIATEQRFLDSLDVLLQNKSLAQLSIDEIAEHAHQTRGAFLKRFGSKKQSLFILWSRYCKRASTEMAQITTLLPTFQSAKAACIHMSTQLETIQRLDFSANRAMHEDFQENLRIDPQTQKIFLECVELMRCTQRQFLPGTAASDTGAFAAAQLLVTINYNHVLKAMPGLPADPVVRHEMVGEIMALVLSR
jgi:AcrR family transcriptional regulator